MSNQKGRESEKSQEEAVPSPAPPVPPPTRRAPARVTLHTRIREDIDNELRELAEEKEASLQATVETALLFYFRALGRWPEDRD